MRDAQLLAGVDAAVLAAQPFAVDEVRAGQRLDAVWMRDSRSIASR